MGDRMIIPDKIVKALEFYANEDIWTKTDDGWGGWNWSAQWINEYDDEKPWDIAYKALMDIE